MNYRRQFIKCSVVIMIFCGTLCGCLAQQAHEETVPETVETVRAELLPYADELNSFGTISFKTKNDVTAQVGGTIHVLRFREGKEVTKGQTLAVLRNVQLELQRDQAENTLESARSGLKSTLERKRETGLHIESRLLSLERTDITIVQKELELMSARENYAVKNDLFLLGGLTESALKDIQLGIQAQEAHLASLKKERRIGELGLRDSDLLDAGYSIPLDNYEKKQLLVLLNTRSIDAEIASVQSSLKNAEKNLHSVQKLLEELVLVAPVSGIIGARYYEAGEHIKENEKVFTIIGTQVVTAVFSVQEKDIGYFSAGTPVTLEIESLKKIVQSSVSEVSPMADPESGNFTVKADIANKDGLLKPGMFVRCTASRANPTMYVSLPEKARVKKNSTDNSVFSVVNGRLALREIRLAAQKNGILWITDGVAAGELIVLNPSPFFKEGQRVRQ